ncbi:hypothetical protein Tco_1410811 [Tanacetum coccineum]
MAPKRATRSTPVTENPTTTTVTNAQLQAMIDQGVTAALTARDANRNGDDSHTSGTGYNQRFQELALLCVRMFPEESDKVERTETRNQAEGTGTHGMVLALEGGEPDQDPNNIEDEIEA